MAISNAELVLKAMSELYLERDISAIERYWSEPYPQHNPGMADGLGDLPDLVATLPADFKFEPGLVVSEGEYVMLHCRYVGFGPKPMVGVDIFRVVDGKLVEHWDVLQEEVPEKATKSGRSMLSGIGNQVGGA